MIDVARRVTHARLTLARNMVSISSGRDYVDRLLVMPQPTEEVLCSMTLGTPSQGNGVLIDWLVHALRWDPVGPGDSAALGDL